MTLKPPPNSGVNGALWLIAFSLLTIAICMVFLVIEKQFAAPKDSSRAEGVLIDPPVAPRHDRPRLNPGSSPRRPDPFGNLASSPAAETSPSVAELPLQPAPGFLPTTAPPAPGSYLPGVPRIIGQANFRNIVRGRVFLKGTPPPEKETPVPADYPCPPPEPPVLRTRYFIAGTNGGLANTLVQLVSDSNRTVQLSVVTNELIFTDCRLEPAFCVVVRGQPLIARDTLRLAHVLDGFTDALEIPPEGTVSLPTRINVDAPVTVSCKAHPWEQCQVWFQSPVVPFAITDGNGAFSLTNVPPGDYTVSATHWSGALAQKTSQKLSVRAARTNSLDLVIQAPAPETAAQF